MIQISCEKPDRSIDIYMDNFPPPSNLEVLIDVAQDYSGDVKITPTAQGVYLFLVDYGDGTTRTDQTKYKLIQKLQVRHLYH